METLKIGKDYKILGWCKATYIGCEDISGSLQHRFRRIDGFAIYCVAPDRLVSEVQDWEDTGSAGASDR